MSLKCDTRSLAVASLRQYVPDEFVDEITDERRRVAEANEVTATVTALAVELVSLKDTMLTFTTDPAAQASIIGAIATVDRLIVECGKLTASQG